MKVTVFTPTYNRAKELSRVYNSLCSQTCKEFEWLIIDDGSTDNTKNEVERFMQTRCGFKIRYYFKENGGKYTAHNMAVNKAVNELFVCVDSDDYMVKNAIETILKCAEMDLKEDRIGIISLKKDTNGIVLSDKFPKNIIQCKKIDLEQKYHCRGEFTLIYKTSLLKKCLYPIIKNEKFIGENVIYDKLDQYGDMVLLNEVITICEYLENGYTSNFKLLMLNNPTGFKLYYMQRIDLARTLMECINYVIRYNAFSVLSKERNFNYKGKKKFLVVLLKPVGFVASFYYKKERKLKERN